MSQQHGNVVRSLIIGGANCVWDDLYEASKLFIPDIVIAINDIGMYIQDVDHWVTMHPEKMDNWLEKRRNNGFPDPELWTATHRLKNYKGFKTIHSKGGSGVLGVRLSELFLSTHSILAGIPMVADEAHFFDKKKWIACETYRRQWRKEKGFKTFVRSMSGWTQQEFGEPTEDWLKNCYV